MNRFNLYFQDSLGILEFGNNSEEKNIESIQILVKQSFSRECMKSLLYDDV